MPYREELDRSAVEIGSIRIERRSKRRVISDAANHLIRWTFPECEMKFINSLGLVSHHETKGLMARSSISPQLRSSGLVKRLRGENFALSKKRLTFPIEGVEVVRGEMAHKIMALLSDPEGVLEEERHGYMTALSRVTGITMTNGNFRPDISLGHVPHLGAEGEPGEIVDMFKEALPETVHLNSTYIKLNYPRGL